MGRYAYQQGRSTELLLADSDRSVAGSRRQGCFTYVVGLDIQGAFDSAALTQLVDTLEDYNIPGAIMAHLASRFIGNWLTRRNFRIKSGTTCGVVHSEPRIPSRGVPQGGLLSPQLWILHVNNVISRTRERSRD